ncbi:hypothetical protein ACHAWO_005675 [Cyclotella atomus]|uniref:Uncharacterized protein n=1 Tax=Cyclotella atomus TaxID=382360 RepID=A0ABD3NXT2_9STRA
MKLLSATAAAVLASSCSAFAPAASRVHGKVSNDCSSTRLNMNVPFFAQQTEDKKPEIEEPLEDASATMTLDEEVEMLVEKEKAKMAKMSKLSSASGVEYAPWMGITEYEEAEIRSIMREKTAARRARQEQQKDVTGNLYLDSQAQELSGTGLSYKIIDGQVELEWATKSETDTKGFIVKRRAAKTNDYSVIASYKDWGPLASKGVDGGIYRYLDESATPGGWVYRITEEDNSGNSADICQCLVEVQTADEQKAALIAGVGFAVFAVVAVVAGIALDPMQGY